MLGTGIGTFVACSDYPAVFARKGGGGGGVACRSGIAEVFGGGRRVRREQPVGVEGYGHLVVLPDAARDLGDIRPSQQRIAQSREGHARIRRPAVSSTSPSDGDLIDGVLPASS